MSPTDSGTSGPGRVLLAGGGTAGHVSPMLALADCLSRRDVGVHVSCLGTTEGLEARLVPERGYPLLTVSKVPLPRRPSADVLRLPGRLRGAIAQARAALESTGAEVLVGFGGYVCPPAYLAARAAGVPIVVHEQNARPGLANRLGARLTDIVGVTFSTTSLPHSRVVGMPLRTEIATLDRAERRAEALEWFGLSSDWPTVLVFGGSLGAQRLNEAFTAAAGDLQAAGIQVLHIMGRGKLGQVPRSDDGPAYVALEYCDRMDLAYAAADLAIARAGAGTVCELAAVGLPAVYVPLPIGNGEQRLNPAEVVAAGGGMLVDDSLVTPMWVRQTVSALMNDPASLAAMAAAAARTGHRDGDERLADLVTQAYQRRRTGHA
ncbi:MAG: undecaprenyldiphospho-muramoylpentapeptide beta-N-acetylglucosaminyltransferase [Nostocoides sp.]